MLAKAMGVTPDEKQLEIPVRRKCQKFVHILLQKRILVICALKSHGGVPAEEVCRHTEPVLAAGIADPTDIVISRVSDDSVKAIGLEIIAIGRDPAPNRSGARIALKIRSGSLCLAGHIRVFVGLEIDGVNLRVLFGMGGEFMGGSGAQRHVFPHGLIRELVRDGVQGTAHLMPVQNIQHGLIRIKIPVGGVIIAHNRGLHQAVRIGTDHRVPQAFRYGFFHRIRPVGLYDIFIDFSALLVHFERVKRKADRRIQGRPLGPILAARRAAVVTGGVDPNLLDPV